MRQRFSTILAVAFATATLSIVGIAAAQQKAPPPLEKRTYGAPPTLPMTMPNVDDLTPEEAKRLQELAESKEGSWADFLMEWATPRPVPKATVVMVDEKYGYPHIAVSFKMEVVPTPEGMEDDPDVVWMRGIPPEDPLSPLNKMWEERQAREIFFKMQRAWEEEHGESDYFLDFTNESVPAPFVDSLEFQSNVKGLPADGRWQMNFSIADMNEDGQVDLVFPPTRKGTPQPMIFLGTGDGGFTIWKAPRWSNDVPSDYGAVVVGDFDGDGHQDVVLAIHFKGQYVFYGNGAGDFTRSKLLPSPDPRITSRAPAAADFDGDGRMDVAFLAEIDYDLATSSRIDSSTTVWVVFSREEGWQLAEGKIIAGVIGDTVEAADVNRDGRPDLVIGSNSTNFRSLVLINEGEGTFARVDYPGVLSNALHSDIAVADKTVADTAGADTAGAATHSDIFATFVQFLYHNEENLVKTGIIHYSAAGEGIIQKGTPVFFDDQRFDPFFRLGIGDVDGNGLTDVVAGRKNGELEVYLQMEGGAFYKEVSAELDGERGTVFDIQLIDLDGDGRDDIIASFADKDERKGGIRVWLSYAKK